MELHHLRTFREVVRERSFTAAAKNLLLTQPAVSQQVKALETELGERLLHRDGRDVQPTEADIAGSAALMIVPTAGMTPASAAWQPFIALLDRLAAAAKLAGKVGAVIDAGDSQTVASFSSALAARGFALIALDRSDARTHGRAVGATVIGAVNRASR